jgi:hypothetical protein
MREFKTKFGFLFVITVNSDNFDENMQKAQCFNLEIIIAVPSQSVIQPVG